MKYPIEAESLAYFCRVKVNVSDKVVRDFLKDFPPSNPKPKQFHVIHDIRVINSNGLIPMVIIERPNDADRALQALQLEAMNGSTSKKTIAKKPKRMDAKKSTKSMKAKPTNTKKPVQKKQKTSRPLFVLPKSNKTGHSKKN